MSIPRCQQRIVHLGPRNRCAVMHSEPRPVPKSKFKIPNYPCCNVTAISDIIERQNLREMETLHTQPTTLFQQHDITSNNIYVPA
jgi:hypothetical protein